MSDGLTYEQAAALLGCHFSNVAKLIRKGDLTSTGTRGASLSREQVEALAARRAAEREAKAARSPPEVRARRPSLRHRSRVALPETGRRAPGRHAAGGPGPHSPRHASCDRERRPVLGATGSGRAGGGGAAGAEDRAAVETPTQATSRICRWRTRSAYERGFQQLARAPFVTRCNPGDAGRLWDWLPGKVRGDSKT
jgi:excisionase family DNA binding protein